MSNNYKKTYLKGSAQEKKFDGGGSVINVSIAEEDFQKIPTNTSSKGVKYRVFSIGTRKEKDDYGNTHSVHISEKEGEAPSAPASEDTTGWV